LQIKTRNIVVWPKNGGKACPAANRLVAKQECNVHACPVDCVVSQWSSFGECSKECGGGVQFATRFVLVKPEHGGNACPALATQPQECNTFECGRPRALLNEDEAKQAGDAKMGSKNVSKHWQHKKDSNSHHLGCFEDKPVRDLKDMLASRTQMTVRQCRKLAKSRGLKFFALQDGTDCYGDNKYGAYGPSESCINRKGGPWANSVYFV